MTYQVNAVLVEPHQRSEIIFSLAHHRVGSFVVLFSQPQQQMFFQDVLLNCNYSNLTFLTFHEYLKTPQLADASVMLMDVPENFETAEKIFEKAANEKSTTYLVLLKINKKYLQMLPKKVTVTTSICSFSPNKFVGINDKLRDLVEKSYDFNRAAFYAYGSFINTFRANMLTRIFRTDQIDVEKLALSFGFTTPPRVKEGKFLTQKAQQEKRRQKKTADSKPVASMPEVAEEAAEVVEKTVKPKKSLPLKKKKIQKGQ
jgi:ATP-dependent RNA helicase DDX18/HAS1